MFQLFTDTDCDVSPKIAEEYGYKLISMPYSVDGKTIFPYVDYTEFNSHEFYESLRNGVLPSTSAISAEHYRKYFEPVFAEGKDIIYVHFSSEMTMTFDVMGSVVKELKEKYPERNFYSIDTKGITAISLNIVCEIGDLAKNGKTPDDIVKWAETEIDKFAMYFFADDLKFFKKSGRVSGLAAIMGTLVGVRPIIYMNSQGKMESIGKERGRNKAIERLISYVDELGDNVLSHRVIIGHTDSPEVADEIAAELKEKYGQSLNIVIVPTNPTAGSHCGPNGVGICFHAVHR